MPTTLSTQAGRRDGIEILSVSGEIDLSNSARLGREIEASVRPDAPLVLDLTDVEFLDSAGTRALAVADGAAAKLGAALLLVPSEFIAHVLEVAGLGPAFRIYGSLDEALEVARGLLAGGGAPKEA
jgi:anti-anti-sigma factor